MERDPVADVLAVECLHGSAGQPCYKSVGGFTGYCAPRIRAALAIEAACGTWASGSTGCTRPKGHNDPEWHEDAAGYCWRGPWAPRPQPEQWRAGRSVGRTVYIGDRLVGLMDTPELAAIVVAAVNGRAALAVPRGEAREAESVTPRGLGYATIFSVPCRACRAAAGDACRLNGGVCMIRIRDAQQDTRTAERSEGVKKSDPSSPARACETCCDGDIEIVHEIAGPVSCPDCGRRPTCTGGR